MLDKRLNAYRDDLADIRLKGQVESQAFREGHLMQMRGPITTLHRAPAFDAAQDTQVLMGEIMRVFDVVDGWAWVQLQCDSYVGYLRHESLNAELHVSTHKIAVPSTLLFTKPSIKTQPVQFLPMNAEITVVNLQDDFVELITGGFIFAKHVKPVAENYSDFVAVAEQFLHTPYYWGGKSYHGQDCSGLVQTALQACGLRAPRDADLQEAELGVQLQINDLDGLRRGDLLFWKGHVGIMQNDKSLLHANGHHMQVTSEPLKDVISRSQTTETPITSIKRM